VHKYVTQQAHSSPAHLSAAAAAAVGGAAAQRALDGERAADEHLQAAAVAVGEGVLAHRAAGAAAGAADLVDLAREVECSDRDRLRPQARRFLFWAGARRTVAFDMVGAGLL
jgi:hypothetical protein